LARYGIVASGGFWAVMILNLIIVSVAGGPVSYRYP
jgi:hypothetical protein